MNIPLIRTKRYRKIFIIHNYSIHNCNNLTNKERYRQFCETEKGLPLFSQAWYLDVVCEGGEWDVALVQKDQKIIAAFPYFLKRKSIFSYITQPELCRMMGPYIIPDYRRLKQEHKLLAALIEQLPKFDFFNQNFHYHIQNWLPFFWKEFEQTTHYSYRINCENLETVHTNMYKDYRRKIKKAKEILTVTSTYDIATFYEISKMSFDRQGIALPFSFDFLKKIHQAIEAQQCGQLFFAVDGQGQIHSARYLVWDQQSSYGLMSGDDPTLRNSGGALLLIWEAIRYTKEELNLPVYDFAGSMLPAVEQVRRQFGAIQAPYFNIQKSNSTLFQILSYLKG